eukprot:1688763-Pleurochrysis_carterae.AAC.2
MMVVVLTLVLVLGSDGELEHRVVAAGHAAAWLMLMPAELVKRDLTRRQRDVRGIIISTITAANTTTISFIITAAVTAA